ncbi:MAG: teichoic acid biosynthesis protein [Proteobacteria bacterium]|nr:teichoic acid biosynthesis protein [Pseudomonadota bacterium]
MKILYGVVGEGMGHATRSCVVLEHLLRLGHDLRVVVSGRAHGFLQERFFFDHPNIAIEEIHGLTLSYEGNAVDKSESFWDNLEKAPAGLLKNLSAYQKIAEDGFSPDLVISDFESWAYFYGLHHELPVISIDNMQVINRCQHDDDILAQWDYQIAKAAVKFKLPGAYHYLVTSFFFPPVRKERTTLVPPILRPEILAAKREPSDHVLVYQTSSANEKLLPTLKTLPYQFRVYGMGKEGIEGNITLCAFSETGFVDDLRTARGVVAGGGFSLMSEAVHLHVPMLSIPLKKQFEQELNARYLAKLGYGAWTENLDAEKIVAFLENTDSHAQALQSYPSHDNSMLLTCVEELVRDVDLDEPRPIRLESKAMGKFWGPPLPEEIL